VHSGTLQKTGYKTVNKNFLSIMQRPLPWFQVINCGCTALLPYK